MFKEVVKMLSLDCTVPSSTASSKVIFDASARDGCSQARLNHLLTLVNTNSGMLPRDAVKEMEVCFAKKTPERKKAFGYM